MSRYQNAGQSHNIKFANVSFERVEQFKYLGTIITNQNSIQDEMKSTLPSECACCHSVQNLFFLFAIQKYIHIKVHSTIICLLF